MNVIRGSCLCGGIKYEIDGALGTALYCHCSMCRKFHGSAFRARVSVSKAAFRFTQGEALLTSYRSSADTVKRFCKICGSAMVNSWDPEPDMYGLAMGSLDDDPGIRAVCHIFVGSKAPWHEITDGLPQFREFPEEA
jgi:hypothetical protein